MNFFYSIGIAATILFATFSAKAQDFEGFALYNSINNKTAYLIDKDGNIAHRWNCDLEGNYTVLLKENGNIVRGAIKNNNIIRGAAVGGILQELDKDANVVWEFQYSDATKVQHHDITLMPQGGVLFTAWEVKDRAELFVLGYDGNSNEKYPTHFVEIRQIPGTNTAEIVWEWHIIDHMVQNVNNTLTNFGKIEDNPHLMDINIEANSFGGDGDWFHVNGVDYSEELDLITFSSRFLSEIFVIDHSTTTAEAASHSGGNSGMGGDFLYRWGNPQNYNTPGNRRISGPCHDARFIPDDGRFRGGFIQFFNNSGPAGISTVSAIDPPYNGKTFDRTLGEAFEPQIEDFSHTTRGLARGQSASDAMPNGNTFVNMSAGFMYEVDTNDNVVWQYSEGPAKAFRYGCDHPGIIALLGTNPCGTSSADDYLVEKNLKIFPNPTDGLIHISGLSGEHELQNVQISDPSGKIIFSLPGNPNTIDFSGQPAGVYFMKFNFGNQKSQTKLVSVAE